MVSQKLKMLIWKFYYKFVNEICKSDEFWRLKFPKTYSQQLYVFYKNHKTKGESWKSLYFKAKERIGIFSMGKPTISNTMHEGTYERVLKSEGFNENEIKWITSKFRHYRNIVLENKFGLPADLYLGDQKIKYGDIVYEYDTFYGRIDGSLQTFIPVNSKMYVGIGMSVSNDYDFKDLDISHDTISYLLHPIETKIYDRYGPLYFEFLAAFLGKMYKKNKVRLALIVEFKGDINILDTNKYKVLEYKNGIF